MIVVPVEKTGLDTANAKTQKNVLTKEHTNTVSEKVIDFNTLMQVIIDYEREKGGVVAYCDGYTTQVVIRRNLDDKEPYRFIRYLGKRPGENTLNAYRELGFIEDPDFKLSVSTMKDLLRM